MTLRTSQRGVSTGYSYDGWGRLDLVDYSDTTPDVKFEYFTHSGLLQKRHDGWATAAVRVTTYTTGFEGSVTGESVNDAGSVISLTRGLDSWGRQTTLNTSWTSGTGPVFTGISAPSLSYGHSGSQRLAQMTSGTGWTMDLSWGLGESLNLQKPGSYGYYFNQNWAVDANGRASSKSGYGYGYNSSGSIYSYFNPTTVSQRWSGDRLAARSSGSDRRWEYRYNARGEVDSAWQQTGLVVIPALPAQPDPAAGETLAGTGTSYAYDAIGNRLSHTDGGRGSSVAIPAENTVNGVVSSTVTLQDPLPHVYTPNAANQYIQIAHPAAFDVRGTRTAGATIAVNGVKVATPTPTAVSGYQTGGNGTIFRARVTNTAPSGTGNPDLYEPVTVTQNGSILTVDDPIQYIAKPTQTLTYDADGNLKTDGRWTYTWDAADRLIKMESPAFYQPAVVPVYPDTSPASALVNVPAKVIEFAYDGLSRRIRKKVMEGTSTIAVWEAYVYDGWNMVLSVKLNPEVGASQGRPQSAIASYVWRPDLGSTPFARRNWQAAGGVRGLVMANYFTGANGGGIHLPVMDAMGNVTQVVRAGVQLNYNGDSMRSEFVYDYDAFGKETRSSTLVAGLNPDSFPFHFSTKFTDPESGFNYYGYRFYDPANGRWTNRDSIAERGGLNLYGMVGNDAVNSVDYLGNLANPRSETASVDASITGGSATEAAETAKMFSELAGSTAKEAAASDLMKIMRDAALAASAAYALTETMSEKSERKKVCDDIKAKKKSLKGPWQKANDKKGQKAKEKHTGACTPKDYCDALYEALKQAQELETLRKAEVTNACDDFAPPGSNPQHPEEAAKAQIAREAIQKQINDCISKGWKPPGI